MAGGTIDNIVHDKVKQEVKELTTSLEIILAKLLEINEASRKGNAPLQVKKPTDLSTQIDKNKKSIDAMNKSLAQTEKIRQTAIKTREKQVNAESSLSQRLVAQRKKEEAQTERNRKSRLREADAIDRNKRALDRQRQAALKNNTVFGRLNKTFGRFATALGLTSGIFLFIRAIRNTTRRIIQFDKSMVGLSAILKTNRRDLKAVENEIKRVAGSSIKTSNEVADLATKLATLGKTKEEIINLLEPVNNLSIGLQATSEEAGELLIQTLNAFGKGSESAEEFADIIARMRTSTALDFERIKDALGFLSPTARAAGISFERTGAILGVLVDNGIKAARAGRLMSTAFLKLAKDGKSLDDALDEINIAQGKNVTNLELLKIAGDLFGARAAALGLVLADNRDKVADLTKEYENAKGSLDELTKKQLESLDAKLKILDATWEKFIINIENGEGVISDAFKSTIQLITDLINEMGLINEVTPIIGDRINIFKDFIADPLGLAAGIETTAKATALLKLLNEEFKELKKEGVDELTFAYNLHIERLDKLNDTDKAGIALFEFQLARINELIAAKKKQARSVQDEKDDLMDLILLIDDKLDMDDLEKLSLKELTDLLSKLNAERGTANELIKGSIGFIQKMISENEKLIKATADDTYRRRLLQENQLLAKQIELMLKVPEAVEAINAVSVGVVTQEEAKRRTKAGEREGTALAGGSKGLETLELKLKELLKLRAKIESGDITDVEGVKVTVGGSKIDEQIEAVKSQIESDTGGGFIEGLTPTLLDVDGPSAIENALGDITSFVDEYQSQIDQAIDITNSFFDNRIQRIDQDIEANNRFFANQIALAEGNVEKQRELEEARQQKDAELQKKKRKEMEKQAIFNKVITTTSIALNTASAIVAALAPPPVGLGPVVGLPLAIATGVLGAAQLAVALATPIPKFKKGKSESDNYEGFAVWGEERPEIKVSKDGSVEISPDKPTLTHVKKDDVIYPSFNNFKNDALTDMSDLIYNATVMASLNSNTIERVKGRYAGKEFDWALYQGKLGNEIKQGIKRGFKYAKIENNIEIDTDFYKRENDNF